MSIVLPELETVDNDAQNLRYLKHGWPDLLCRWHAHKEFARHLIIDTNGKIFVGDYIGIFWSWIFIFKGSASATKLDY
tara:strand:- start:593 stop:826 length:234 start_codon:yes stop_codon:yes gene_type:complete